MPEAIRDLATDLEKCYNIYFRRWKLTNPNFLETGGALTWKNRTGIITSDEYEEFYQKIIDDIQYSLIMDEAALQIYFQSNDGKVSEANLAFIPKPGSGLDYFRIDCDFGRARDYTHTTYHGHFGFNCHDMRFSVREFPFPSQFVRFCRALAFGAATDSFDRQKFLNRDLVQIGSKHHHCFSFIFA